MQSYGFIFMNVNEHSIDKEQIFGILSMNQEANQYYTLEQLYQRNSLLFQVLNNRNPDSNEEAMIRLASEEFYSRVSAPWDIQRMHHLIKLSHPILSIENIKYKTQQISHRFPLNTVCGVAGFDGSAFLLYLFKNDEMLTLHQVGEELADMGLNEASGNISKLSEFFMVPFSSAAEFTHERDAMTAEALFFNCIASIDLVVSPSTDQKHGSA